MVGVSDQARNWIDEEIEGTAVTRMLDLAEVFELAHGNRGIAQTPLLKLAIEVFNAASLPYIQFHSPAYKNRTEIFPVLFEDVKGSGL
jgi:hypothetical protein